MERINSSQYTPNISPPTPCASMGLLPVVARLWNMFRHIAIADDLRAALILYSLKNPGGRPYEDRNSGFQEYSSRQQQ